MQACAMDLPTFPADAPRRLLVGFSGGRDSTVLLHRLATQPEAPWTGVRAIHVHHGLHSDADDWASHCESQAAALGVPCTVHRVAVQPAGRGLEDAARRARYAALVAERRSDECLVLAHHRGDQAETLLLALLRGSGERGLSAMRGFTVDARGPIWRPLLDIPEAAVAAYALQQGLTWIDDPSNHDEQLSRNHLRRTVLPLLRRQWPQVEASLARSARHLADADDLLREHARRDLATLLGLRGDTLDVAALRALPEARATRALRLWAESNDLRLTGDVIGRVFGQWARHPPGRALQHALGHATLRQWGGRLWLTPREATASAPGAQAKASPTPLVWDGRSALRLGPGADGAERGTLRLLGAEGFEAPLWRVSRRDAPARFRAAGDRHARPLQEHFAALAVPPWERDTVPLLVDAQGELQALGDLAYGEAFDAWLRARGARLLWQPGDPHG
jgi:tRNA(Ile)-lysidine synthase